MFSVVAKAFFSKVTTMRIVISWLNYLNKRDDRCLYHGTYFHVCKVLEVCVRYLEPKNEVREDLSKQRQLMLKHFS